jgi:putative ABC transport system permease protein
MFLAWKEIIHSKGKFSLIVIMVVLISYLVYFLTSLAYGLASSYTNGLDKWNADSIVLTLDSNDNAMMSVMTDSVYDAIEVTSEKARLGLIPSIAKKGDDATTKANVYVFGVDSGSFLLPSETPSSGLADGEAVADSSLEKYGYVINDSVTLVGTSVSFTIVAFTSSATYQTAPIVYMNLASWKQIRYSAVSGNVFSAAVVKGSVTNLPDGLKNYSMSAYAYTLPGYSAQVATFSLMIGFLIVIASFVLGVFTYVLTMQKASMFGVMKAQGISSFYISNSVIQQTIMVTLIGIALGFALTMLTGLFLAGKMPFAANYLFYGGISLAFVLFSVLGALFSVRAVLKIDPLKAIG